MTHRSIAQYIDHTLLQPGATRDDVARLCDEAKAHRFASVCVNPFNVAQAAQASAGSGVKVCTVIGFPLGATTTAAKAAETRDAVANGADELDMVLNVGALNSGDLDAARRDIEAVVAAADGRVVKVILETGLLTNDQKVLAAGLVQQAGAHFVKTCTGFSVGQATVDDIRLLRNAVGPDFGVKASGGVRDYETAKAMIDAGASRIGATKSIAIIEGEQ